MGIPGQDENDFDSAIFSEHFSADPLQIYLDNGGSQSFSPILAEVHFDADSLYAIFPTRNSQQEAQLSFFRPAPDPLPQLTIASSPSQNVKFAFIAAPILLKTSTEFVLEDDTNLQFQGESRLTSDTTEVLYIMQSSAPSTMGTGILSVTTTPLISPFRLVIDSATVDNQHRIIPQGTSDAFLIQPSSSERNATFINSGLHAMAGPAASGAFMGIDGTLGTVTVTNSGVGAIFGPLATGSMLSINNAVVMNSGQSVFLGPMGASEMMITSDAQQTTTVTNNGKNAFLGPQGPNGTLTISGINTTVNNVGISAKIGVQEGGTIAILGGNINNLEGALFRAGFEGTFDIQGGNMTNDLISTLGSTTEEMTFIRGTITNDGNMLALNYTQQELATLHLRFTSFPSVYGNIVATNTAAIDGTLIVTIPSDAAVPPNLIIDLITAEGGVSGTYHTVDFINFPETVIHTIDYTTTAVQLITAQVVTPSLIGSVPFASLHSIVEINTRIGRNQSFIHRRLFNQQSQQKQSTSLLIASSAPLAELRSPQRQQKQDQLGQRLIKDWCATSGPTRAYIGPVGHFGSFSKLTDLQLGFDYHSYGFFTGIDHAFEDWGVGADFDYRAISGDANGNAAGFTVHQVHGGIYSVWAPRYVPGFALNSLVGFGYDRYNIRREAGPSHAPVEAVGRPNGLEADAVLGINYIFSYNRFAAIPKYLAVTPFLNVQFDWLSIDDFSESEDEVYALKVDSQQLFSLQSAIGIRLDYLIHTRKVCLQPQLSLAWQYEYLNLNHTIHLTTTHLSRPRKEKLGVIAPGRHTLLLGIDLLAIAFRCFEVEASYDFQWNSSYQNHSIYIGTGGYF
ncbi:MAG: autotransporter domain-containing protein [Chlamydiota bacterium]